VGDTIGCGIDYGSSSGSDYGNGSGSVHTPGIFFTLNGQLLGYAWKDTTKQAVVHDFLQHKHIYPVVGIDTNHVIHANYGGPFQFDLTSFCVQQHEARIQQGFQWKPFTKANTTVNANTTTIPNNTAAKASSKRKSFRTKR
jgi:hypothetical protein